MKDRIKKLRAKSLQIRPYITPERAKLLTEFYRQPSVYQYSIPVQRALAFKCILENKEIFIDEGELIVGERGPAPKATPTYPEVTCHSLEDLDVLNNREKLPYRVDESTRRLYQEEIIPFWRGRAIRDIIFREMDPEWVAAYEAGVFTEFMEQRAPGHTVLGDKIYRQGLLDFKKEIEATIARLDFLRDPEAYAKREELKAMSICAEALMIYAQRHAQKAREMAAQESNPERRKELLQIAAICEHVPARAPRNFWEALQYYWFV
ncbi:MAG TPA: formate C-acetyltransferase/glycerol dehydratase family glycyl radical enzyme, partial [Candidatus Aminicenantes bacterium]|nr:formate C-acetyltransferase/glycerol dehydratase family glycyl radical enzyme [Candidatus Aminicenantes bacterium]